MARGYQRQNDMAYGYRNAYNVKQSYHVGDRSGIPSVDYGSVDDNIRDYNNDPDYNSYRFNEPPRRRRRHTRSYAVPGPEQRGRVRSIPGPYQGMGPKDYRRSDQRIEEDVNDLLTRHGGINARDINVNVKDGEVTLTGAVHSRGEKRLAEDLIDSVPGVRDVQNQLKVSALE